MQTYYGLDDIRETLPAPVVTLGNFDGVHLGHQRIFKMLQAQAREVEGTDVVLTFFPHPLKVLCPEKAPPLITTLEERLRLIQACGNAVTVCIPFTREFARFSPEDFVRGILVDKLGVRRILVGDDTRFGRNRKGDLPFLMECGKRFGFVVQRIEPVKIEGKETSSTRIRECVRCGEMRESAAMLGRHYGITGMVRKGERRGRRIGFPTANLSTEAELLPLEGVYTVWVFWRGTHLPAVANLGTNPTFAGQQISLEVHLLDFDEELYGETLRVDFVERIRAETRFPDVESLVAQIRKDVLTARKTLSAEPPPRETELAPSTRPGDDTEVKR